MTGSRRRSDDRRHAAAELAGERERADALAQLELVARSLAAMSVARDALERTVEGAARVVASRDQAVCLLGDGGADEPSVVVATVEGELPAAATALVREVATRGAARSVPAEGSDGPMAAAPLRVEDRVLGVLLVLREPGDPDITLTQRRLLEALGAHAALAVERTGGRTVPRPSPVGPSDLAEVLRSAVGRLATDDASPSVSRRVVVLAANPAPVDVEVVALRSLVDALLVLVERTTGGRGDAAVEVLTLDGGHEVVVAYDGPGLTTAAVEASHAARLARSVGGRLTPRGRSEVAQLRLWLPAAAATAAAGMAPGGPAPAQVTAPAG